VGERLCRTPGRKVKSFLVWGNIQISVLINPDDFSVNKRQSDLFYDPNDMGSKIGANTGSLREFLDCEMINRIINEEKHFGANFLISKIDKRGNYRSTTSKISEIIINRIFRGEQREARGQKEER
jgi:hypothetical protein